MNLYEATRHLHHACERHPLGARMAKGELTREEWAQWLDGFRVLHAAIDEFFPAHMRRDGYLAADLVRLPQADPAPAALRLAEFAAGDEKTCLGVGYVLHGAHRRGGRIMRPVLEAAQLPCAHIRYDEPVETERVIQSLRERADLLGAAAQAFGALLRAMDEIRGSRA